jgi:EAL domain-containing protein (putative c-di-GMP-specific phosphodiesterase class I)
MDLEVVVEGVETAEQRNFLIDEGCRVGQGYYFSRPVAEDELLRMLEQNSPLPLSPELPRLPASQETQVLT